MPYLSRCPLKRLDASTALPVSTSAVNAKNLVHYPGVYSRKHKNPSN
jgi:hypothetical protein